METLAHEGTHQLTFNTGLLNRMGDVPLCIAEGLGTFGEARKTMGPSPLGRINLQRMDDLARIQRRISWTPLRELIGSDGFLRSRNLDRTVLSYAQSWLLVYYMLKEPAAIPRFRQYLQAIRPRLNADRRVQDAEAIWGILISSTRSCAGTRSGLSSRCDKSVSKKLVYIS